MRKTAAAAAQKTPLGELMCESIVGALRHRRQSTSQAQTAVEIIKDGDSIIMRPSRAQLSILRSILIVLLH